MKNVEEIFTIVAVDCDRGWNIYIPGEKRGEETEGVSEGGKRRQGWWKRGSRTRHRSFTFFFKLFSSFLAQIPALRRRYFVGDLSWKIVFTCFSWRVFLAHNVDPRVWDAGQVDAGDVSVAEIPILGAFFNVRIFSLREYRGELEISRLSRWSRQLISPSFDVNSIAQRMGSCKIGRIVSRDRSRSHVSRTGAGSRY